MENENEKEETPFVYDKNLEMIEITDKNKKKKSSTKAATLSGGKKIRRSAEGLITNPKELANAKYTRKRGILFSIFFTYKSINYSLLKVGKTIYKCTCKLELPII